MTATGGPRCFDGDRLEAIAGYARPWAPGRREDDMQMQQAADNPDRLWCMSEVDIFCDLDEREMEGMSRAAPIRTYASGELVFSPHEPVQALFILKEGRVRIFRVSEDCRALTTAIIEPGTIFGEMVTVGQQMHGSFAEAMDEAVVCVMSQVDVRRLLLGDPRIAARIAETMGRRLGELEQRLTDAVFKSVPERVAGAVATLAQGRSWLRGGQVRVTHEQLAALAGTSRETTTKVLGELATQGTISLGRGRITVLDLDRLREIAG